MKLPTKAPRVTRSTHVHKSQMIAFNGEQFEDGKIRYVVSYDMTAENIEKLTEALISREEADAKLQKAIDTINAVLYPKK